MSCIPLFDVMLLEHILGGLGKEFCVCFLWSALDIKENTFQFSEFLVIRRLGLITLLVQFREPPIDVVTSRKVISGDDLALNW